MRHFLWSLYFALISGLASRALHIYLDANEKRCFIEELPTNTVVEGHYKALEWSEAQQQYILDRQFGHSCGSRGDHSICLSTNYTSWFSSTHIRLYIDIVVGTTKADLEHDRSHVSELAGKVRDLNQKLEDIRREQQYQREREADYRDLSEVTNARAVWYSLAQIVVLVLTCAWQLRHLKNFFEDRKAR
ncbi:hypothetical protein MPER_13029 [Moniliophthora perniciosa FA553]|nr:hypothetical protein MPER_13029 [Moniliophthora perniciosa FA553]